MTALLPPLVVDVSVRQRGRRGFRIWLPLVLLWPLLLVLAAFALLVAVLVDLAHLAAGARFRHYTALLLHAMHALAAVRGTFARIDRDNTRVNVHVY